MKGLCYIIVMFAPCICTPYKSCLRRFK